jgi:hypothetical protein
MTILKRLPIGENPALLNIHGAQLKLRPYQIIIRVSVSPFREWDPRSPIIPALVDTGLNHHFSIQQQHLSRWAGVHPESLERLGNMREGGRTADLRRAYLWIHRNKTGRRELRDAEPFLVPQQEGIAIYPSDESNYPRLPLLGLRAILKNNLKLTIDGKRKHASLRSPLW